MLSHEDNELLTRVGQDAPMGGLMRQYWMPILLEADLPEAGGLPLRVRLLGEDLLLYMSPKRDLGLVGPHCPHRGASLYYGRNEECGLRCVYHGWQFDTAGNCVDLPNDARGNVMKTRIKHIAYPCRLKGGLVWAYLGEQNPPPEMPDFEWLGLPKEQVHLSIRIQCCNWLQALEGEIDSSHAGFLHSRVDGHGANPWDIYSENYGSPVFEVEPSSAGLQIAARRDAGPNDYYWRINQFMMPFWTVVPPSGPEPDINGHAWVPMDDEHTLCVMYSYKPSEAYSERRLKLYKEGARGRQSGHLSQDGALPFDPRRPFGMYWPQYNSSNDYGIDVEVQKTKYFSGMAGLWVQDAGLQESMGSIADRTQEHLCSGDIGIIQVRRLLKQTALQLKKGEGVHPTVNSPAAYRRRSVGIVLPRNVSWQEGAARHLTTEGDLAYLNS